MAPPTKSFILAEIQRLAAENDGAPVGLKRFQRVTGIGQHAWMGRYWIRWSDALAEAGFEPNTWIEAWPDEELLSALASLTRGLGHFPTHAELTFARNSDPSFPALKAFKRLGNKSALIGRLYGYCAEREDLADVLAILAPLLPVGSAQGRTVGPLADSETGYVYLVRSGAHHKIGRTNSTGRRFYEIGLQLPERLEVVHYIETDDPAGIERYWHERFADRRANGEWFDLTPADVRAFQRRKSFM